jgi:hypothetical protein
MDPGTVAAEAEAAAALAAALKPDSDIHAETGLSNGRDSMMSISDSAMSSVFGLIIKDQHNQHLFLQGNEHKAAVTNSANHNNLFQNNNSAGNSTSALVTESMLNANSVSNQFQSVCLDRYVAEALTRPMLSADASLVDTDTAAADAQTQAVKLKNGLKYEIDNEDKQEVDKSQMKTLKATVVQLTQAMMTKMQESENWRLLYEEASDRCKEMQTRFDLVRYSAQCYVYNNVATRTTPLISSAASAVSSSKFIDNMKGKHVQHPPSIKSAGKTALTSLSIAMHNNHNDNNKFLNSIVQRHQHRVAMKAVSNPLAQHRPGQPISCMLIPNDNSMANVGAVSVTSIPSRSSSPSKPLSKTLQSSSPSVSLPLSTLQSNQSITSSPSSGPSASSAGALSSRSGKMLTQTPSVSDDAHLFSRHVNVGPRIPPSATLFNTVSRSKAIPVPSSADSNNAAKSSSMVTDAETALHNNTIASVGPVVDAKSGSDTATTTTSEVMAPLSSRIKSEISAAASSFLNAQSGSAYASMAPLLTAVPVPPQSFTEAVIDAKKTDQTRVHPHTTHSSHNSFKDPIFARDANVLLMETNHSTKTSSSGPGGAHGHVDGDGDNGVDVFGSGFGVPSTPCSRSFNAGLHSPSHVRNSNKLSSARGYVPFTFDPLPRSHVSVRARLSISSPSSLQSSSDNRTVNTDENATQRAVDTNGNNGLRTSNHSNVATPRSQGQQLPNQSSNQLPNTTSTPALASTSGHHLSVNRSGQGRTPVTVSVPVSPRPPPVPTPSPLLGSSSTGQGQTQGQELRPASASSNRAPSPSTSGSSGGNAKSSSGMAGFKKVFTFRGPEVHHEILPELTIEPVLTSGSENAFNSNSVSNANNNISGGSPLNSPRRRSLSLYRPASPEVGQWIDNGDDDDRSSGSADL